jgi:gas vesicle protein
VQFVLGVAIGIGAGFAVAILLAPDKKKRSEWPPHFPGFQSTETEGNHENSGGIRGVMESVRERVKEASNEARDAKERSEREMLARYEKIIGRKAKA